MTDHDTLASLLDAYLQHLEQGTPSPDLSAYPTKIEQAARRYFAIIDAGHSEFAQSDPADDPVFRALGFDRAGEDIRVNGHLVRRIREGLKLDYSELATRLRNAGAELGVKDLLHLERSTSTPLPQHDVTALASALRASVADIEAGGSDGGALQSFLYSAVFETTIRDWTMHHGGDPMQTARRARAALLTATFRGGEHADVAAFRELLAAFLRSLQVDDIGS